MSNTNNNKIPPLPIWAILFKSSPKPETSPPSILRKLDYLDLKNLYIKKRFNPIKIWY